MCFVVKKRIASSRQTPGPIVNRNRTSLIFRRPGGLAICLVAFISVDLAAQSPPPGPHPTITVGDGPGWRRLDQDDFVRVNGDDQTLVWQSDVAIGNGKPIGVTRSARPYKNFELLVQWRHETPGGNSGVFAWVPMSALEDLQPDNLPNAGIEIQMLDHDFTRQYESDNPGKFGDWFSTGGDVFPVGNSTMTPFPPTSPNGQRSFPSVNLTRGHGRWNQYYVRAVSGTVRLWINGTEVSGGKDCSPAEGYLCLESEGAPITFRDIRIRELP